MPPGRWLASRSRHWTPSCFRRKAQASPEIPAPTTITLSVDPTNARTYPKEMELDLHLELQTLTQHKMPQNSWKTLVEFVREYGARGAEIAMRQRRGYRMESWSYARIVAEANRVDRELEARGLNKGDAVLLWGENSAEWIIAFFGCLLRGVVVVPLDAGSPSEFARQVSGEVDAKLVFRGAALEECEWLPSLALARRPGVAPRRD